MDANSVTFSCAKDDNETLHPYPRENDPAFNEYLPISNVTNDEFDVFVGRANLYHTDHQFVSAPTNGLHHPTGQITINVGISSNTTTHNYVNTTTSYTVTNATYSPTTGVMTLTIPSHKMYVGEYIYLADGAVTFNNGSLPVSTDEVSGRMIRVDAVLPGDRILIVYGTNTNTSTWTYSSGATGAITKPKILGGGVYNHKYVSSTGMAVRGGGHYNHVFEGPTKTTVTDASYNPTSGIMTVTVPNHGWETGDGVIIDDNSIVFTCTQDSGATEHPYPRAKDPASRQILTISNVTTNTFDVQVLSLIHISEPTRPY